MEIRQVRILNLSIRAPFAAAYDFAQQPANFPRWAAGLSDSLRESEGDWIAATPDGEAIVRFSEPNAHGVLDHWVAFEGRAEIYIPLRMVANGEGTEVELMLLRHPGMSDADFERDAALVMKDLHALKRLLESGG